MPHSNGSNYSDFNTAREIQKYTIKQAYEEGNKYYDSTLN